MKPKTYNVRYEHVEPEPLWIDFDGDHIRLTGTLAFFYRLFKTMDCEEKAQTELYPWLMAVKKNGVIFPENAVQIAH